jgi:hypothetical protein
MLEIVFITVFGQAALPLFLIFTLGKKGSRPADWALACLALAALLALLAAVGVWLLLPWYTPWVWAAAGAAAAARGYRGIASGRPAGGGRREAAVRRAALMAGSLACLAALVAAGRGFRPAAPAEAVALAAPLRGGTYQVVHGGYSILINPHMKTLKDPALAAFRGQGYAVDLVKLGPFGLRARGVAPRDLERYAIFGEPVFAPCAGEVVAAEANQPDRAPPGRESENPAGNYVRLRCGGFDVLLAHLQRESVAVSPGERVAAGRVLGRVGNSGRSLEPHLHLHAERAGEPLPLAIGGRLLVRGERWAN